MIPQGFVQDLLARIDIADVVGRHVELKKAGINLKGLCPFHGEKTPSFIVSPSRQTYHCFGCGAHGDAIGFLVEHAGLSFPDAVRELAQQAGIAVPEDDAGPAERARQQAERAQRASLAELLEKATAHYRAQLKASPRAIDYLKGRGLDGRSAARFALGYAPPGWHALASCFARYDDPALVEAGLVIVQGEDGPDRKRYDRFRDRIMFPIRSVKGEVIGFGGRVLGDGEPKYLNSPETPLFSKGRELYGLYEARQGLRARGYALVVEGYMDVVALAQAGLPNAVATLGTACTAEHVAKLFRHTDDVVFAFDGDAAGRRAASRALEAALPHATDLRRVRFLFLPPEHDPDSYVRAHGPDEFEQLVAGAVPLSRQLVEHAGEGLDLATAEGRAALLARARPLWESLPDGALREQLLAELAERARSALPDLAARWGLRSDVEAMAPAPHHGARRVSPAHGARRAPVEHGMLAPRRGARLAAARPWDQVARIVLQDAELWWGLPGERHHRMSQLPGWHGALFAWIERQLTEHGPLPWPGLRALLADEPWAEAVRTLMDGTEILPSASADELQAALAQAESAERRRESDALLGRI
ncbi:MAG: DNA primase [Burkholderiales bacterium]|nr:DNA primase [Burkholderiales bacterium]